MILERPAVPKSRQSGMGRTRRFGYGDQLRLAGAAAGHGEHQYRLAGQHCFFTLLGALDIRPKTFIIADRHLAAEIFDAFDRAKAVISAEGGELIALNDFSQ